MKEFWFTGIFSYFKKHLLGNQVDLWDSALELPSWVRRLLHYLISDIKSLHLHHCNVTHIIKFHNWYRAVLAKVINPLEFSRLKFLLSLTHCKEQRLSTKEKGIYSAGIYLLKVNNRNTRTRCEICSKLTIKILERRQESFWYLYC